MAAPVLPCARGAAMASLCRPVWFHPLFMSVSLRLCCVLVGWLLGADLARAAAYESKLPMAPQVKDLEITILSPFQRLPPTGYAPLEIKINNSSAQAKHWDFVSSSSYWSARTFSLGTRFTLGVEPGTTRSFPILSPLSASSVQLTTSGPGVLPGHIIGLPGSNVGSNQTPFLGLSESLATTYGGQLEKEAKDRHTELAWTPVHAADLPTDWRGLAGFEVIWLLPADLAACAPEQRNALRDWVARGGLLVLHGGERPVDFAEEGFGQVKVEPANSGANLDVPGVITLLLARAPARSLWFGSPYKVGWGMYQSLGEFHPNVGVLALLLIVFALLVGPLNLYVFAGSHRRARLLWTTPVISLAASVVIVLLILFRDGFGGEGERVAVVHLLPGQRKAAVLQEQFSRTGVLTHSEFHTESDVVVVPIAADDLGPRTDREYWMDGRHFSGDWFNSRSVQAQWLEAVVPSRAEVRLLNPQEVKESDAAPVIVSSVDVPLSDFYYLASEHRFWYAPTVKTGERTVLQRTDKLRYNLFPSAGARIKACEGLARRAGHFSAFASTGGAFQETLRTIRWTKQRALYLGAISEGEK